MIEITLSFGNLAEARQTLSVLALIGNQGDVLPVRPARKAPKEDPELAVTKEEYAAAVATQDEARNETKNAQKPATTSAPPPATPSSSTPAVSPETSPPAAPPATDTSSSKIADAAAFAITYPDLQRAIIKLAAKSPNAMRAICTEFQVKTFAGTTDPVLWANALARVNEEIAKQGA